MQSPFAAAALAVASERRRPVVFFRQNISEYGAMQLYDRRQLCSWIAFYSKAL
jgi:hypothetical protein